MSIKITYKSNKSENSISNYALFTNENFQIYGLKKLSIHNQSSQIHKIIGKYNDLDKKSFLFFNISPTKKILLIKLKDNQKFIKNEKIGAKFYDFLKSDSNLKLNFFGSNIKESSSKNKNFFDEFIHGFKLKSYIFDRYKSEKNSYNIELVISSDKKLLDGNKRFHSLIEGTKLTKDLVSEPGNILHPDEYAKRILQLKKVGLKVTVYDKKKTKEIRNECSFRGWSRKCKRLIFSYY